MIKLHATLTNEKFFSTLILNTISFVCENNQKEIAGFGFLVIGGNPTEIYNEHQCYIRFVAISQYYKGHQLGQRLTEKMYRGS